MNTYLSAKPSFASPQPLAASSGLTIPLQISLSNIKLSAFIILVFSKQKGLTLVFRNDPLESLKVSSTFDSIPFVRDYLQKEIEGQLRALLMDEVPAIIHRLSLRLWVPEYRAREDQEVARHGVNPPSEEIVTDPFASPPRDPVDIHGNALDASQVASLSLDSSSETHSLFSQKNLLRLAALTDSHRTLSLFTPGIRDVVFRAWAGPTERGEAPVNNTPVTPLYPSISRMHSYSGSTSTTYTFSDVSDAASRTVRPTLTSYGSASSSLTLGAGRHSKHPARKRKHRVVNLRKPKTNSDDIESVSGDSILSGTLSSAASEPIMAGPMPRQKEDELVTPPQSPQRLVIFQGSPDSIDLGNTPPRIRNPTSHQPAHEQQDVDSSGREAAPSLVNHEAQQSALPLRRPKLRPSNPQQSYQYMSEKQQAGLSPASQALPPVFSPFPYLESSPGGILEQAWMMKMASEIARRMQDEKSTNNGFGDRSDKEDSPPPAYGS